MQQLCLYNEDLSFRTLEAYKTLRSNIEFSGKNIDDYKEYDKSRGLFPKNAIDYMKGYHVYNQKELEESISEIADGVDKYKDDRNAVIHDYHTYTDGSSARRVLDAIGIK